MAINSIMDTIKQLEPVSFEKIKQDLYAVFTDDPPSADFIINAAVNGMSKIKSLRNKVLKPEWLEKGIEVLQILQANGLVSETPDGFTSKPALLKFMQWHRPFSERGADTPLSPIANRDYVSRGKNFSRA